MAGDEERIPDLEFKSPEDGAWYAVSVATKHEEQSEGKAEGASYFDVHYGGVHRKGQTYSVNLRNSSHVKKTRARFRCKSSQLQPSQCADMKRGMRVLASYRSNSNRDLQYFDANVTKVIRTMYHATVNRSSPVKISAVTVKLTFEVLWKEGPSKGQNKILAIEDIRLRSPATIDSHPVIRFLERAVEENKKKAKGGDVLISVNPTVAKYDHKLKSSVQHESTVGSSHTGKNGYVIILNLFKEEGSTSLSGSGNSNTRQENMPKDNTTESKEPQFNTAGKKQKINLPDLNLRLDVPLVPNSNLPVEARPVLELEARPVLPNLDLPVEVNAPVVDLNVQVKPPLGFDLNVAAELHNSKEE